MRTQRYAGNIGAFRKGDEGHRASTPYQRWSEMSALDSVSSSYVEAIRASGLSIFDLLTKDSPLFVPTRDLEKILDVGLRGFSTAGMPLRTRSKVVKSEVCKVLGYPVPKSFRKCKPHARFPGQNFDMYVQASNNLQIWNEELKPRRRYVLVAVGDNGCVSMVKVAPSERRVV